MPTPSLLGFDHVHVFVQDRAAAERWYEEVLGFVRRQDLEFWAAGGGPLTLEDHSGTTHIALFERPREKNRSTIALRCSADAFAAWRKHLATFPGLAVTVEDHALSMSLYLRDPDGNPYEITTYEYDAAKAGM
jgi:catechol-2,3-dioxygenase